MAEAPKHALSLLAVEPAELAGLLSRVGGQPITVAKLEADIAAGAPTNADGTVNLIHYAAWLVNRQPA
jgi:hypothetical protein